MSNTLDLCDFLGTESLAKHISEKYQTWESFRGGWLAEKKEIQDYIFATDTSSTSASLLPWKNRTHIPKLCQIRDNLHANYMATLFPSDSAIIWEGDDTDSQTYEKRKIIEAYMTNKLQQSNFRTEVSRLVLDYIDYGMVFAMPTFEANYIKDVLSGDETPVYIGPRLNRISPADIVFDPTASTFEESPKIVRSLRTLGSLQGDIETKPEFGYFQEIFDKMKDTRSKLAAHTQGDFVASNLYDFNGFAGYWEYFNSDYVEVLDFFGDIYDPDSGKLKRNHLLSVVDRSWVIRDQPNSNWTGHPSIRSAGWRQRQDNLYSMGPLDNLLGMQHRIDHIENMKADAWDQFTYPIIKVKGYVEDFEFKPNARIYTGEEGDVDFMRPDLSFLQADNQVTYYENKMEEMAGAPKQAMGFRTPGEKTAYEVQTLENSANRIFINKISHFEEVFLEPLLNDMLEIARRNFDKNDTIRVLDDETQAVTFETITKDDIVARGKVRPIGARHFAQNATILQNLTQFASSPLAQDQTVLMNISGKAVARAVETLLGLEKYKIVQPNIRLYEMAEIAQLQASLQQAHDETQTAGLPADQAANAVQSGASQPIFPPMNGAKPSAASVA